MSKEGSSPSFVRKVMNEKGLDAVKEMARKGGKISGGKRSQEAAARNYLKEEKKRKEAEDMHKQNENIRFEDGEILPPDPEMGLSQE